MARPRRPRGRLCCVCANGNRSDGSIGAIITAVPVESSNAYYAADVPELLRASPEEVIGVLTTNGSFSVEPAQRDAWLHQIPLLQSALLGVDGTIFLEFVVPRIGSRLDAVVISGPAIFAIEFKVGESNYRRADLNQVWDYALDLKIFTGAATTPQSSRSWSRQRPRRLTQHYRPRMRTASTRRPDAMPRA